MLVYCVAVAMLAYWPWNLLLLFVGAAYGAGLYGRNAGGLLATDAGNRQIKFQKSITKHT